MPWAFKKIDGEWLEGVGENDKLATAASTTLLRAVRNSLKAKTIR